MKYFTEVPFPQGEPKIKYGHNVFFLGSCFSENIGNWFRDLRFRCTVNPIGITYNPISIAHQLEGVSEIKAALPEHIVQSNEQWHTLDAHSSISAADKTALENRFRENQEKSASALKDAQFIFLTFGTSIGFEFLKTGKIVNNCHRLPGGAFTQVRISAETAYNTMESGIKTVLSENPQARFLLSVSPIRHLRHGAVENARSKARLIEVCDRLERTFSEVQYLPVFEFVMDELRDYRFYNDRDLIHLNELGLQAVKSKVKQSLIHPDSHELMDRIEKWNKMKNHKIVNPESERTQKFLEKIESEDASINAVLKMHFNSSTP
ncbi:MAG TPA: GSCFA domain-containing protein [Cryomorphaceae bacterium]|nr:GSCFA domain-containing protein [Cryomorphaceae bacterium]